MRQKSYLFIFALMMFGLVLMAAVSVDPKTRRTLNVATSEATPTAQPALPTAEAPMGFKVWKEKRVAQAKVALEAVKRPVEPPKKVESPEGIKEAERQLDLQAERLRQLEFNLEIALGLTIHDYFALYLKNKSKEEMSEAVKQLSPSELSELLVAYRETLFGAPFNDREKSKKLDQNL